MKNEEIYKRIEMEEKAMGMNCRKVDCVNRNIMKWYGNVRRM